jgi:hypothetical protein
MTDDEKYLGRGLLSPVLDWPAPEVEVVVYTDDAIDRALVAWSWPERRTTLH